MMMLVHSGSFGNDSLETVVIISGVVHSADGTVGLNQTVLSLDNASVTGLVLALHISGVVIGDSVFERVFGVGMVILVLLLMMVLILVLLDLRLVVIFLYSSLMVANGLVTSRGLIMVTMLISCLNSVLVRSLILVFMSISLMLLFMSISLFNILVLTQVSVVMFVALLVVVDGTGEDAVECNDGENGQR